MNILLVEDEERVATFIRRGLRGEGMTVEHAPDAEQALVLLAEGTYDIAIFDVMLPGLSGIDLCRRIRAQGYHLPVLMLSALDGTDERIAGLDVGADDYLTKPFEFDELIARITALTRRASLYSQANPAEAAKGAGRLRFDKASLQVFVDDVAIEVSGKERDLLAYFLGNAGKVLSRERILNAVWGADEDPLTNIVDVYVGRIRKKIDPYGKSLATVRSVGYRYDPPE